MNQNIFKKIKVWITLQWIEQNMWSKNVKLGFRVKQSTDGVKTVRIGPEHSLPSETH